MLILKVNLSKFSPGGLCPVHPPPPRLAYKFARCSPFYQRLDPPFQKAGSAPGQRHSIISKYTSLILIMSCLALIILVVRVLFLVNFIIGKIFRFTLLCLKRCKFSLSFLLTGGLQASAYNPEIHYIFIFVPQ